MTAEPLTIEFPLSRFTSVYVEISGQIPTRQELRQMVVLLDAITVGMDDLKTDRPPAENSVDIQNKIPMVVPELLPTPAKRVKRKYGTRKMKDLGDCPIHKVNQRSPNTNRCIHCTRAHLQVARPKFNGNDSHPVPRAIVAPAMVWSEIQRNCLVCGDRAVRYHRSEMSTPKEFWVHDKPSGVKPCLLQIEKHDFILDDPDHVPED